MNHVAPELPSFMSDSAIRRIGRSLLSRLKRRFVPYMTRKHDQKEVDPSQVTWRSFQTLMQTAIGAGTVWIAAHMGTSNDTTGLQHSVERLTNTVEMLQGEVKATGNRMQMVETKIDSTIKRVDALQSAVDGVVRGMRL